jgi:hypothetical protein
LSEVEDEYENVTLLISMPCNSEVTDDGGNVWSLKGKYILECGEPHVFQYVTSRMETIKQGCVNGNMKLNDEWKNYPDKEVWDCKYSVDCVAKCCVKDARVLGAFCCETNNLTFEKCH